MEVMIPNPASLLPMRIKEVMEDLGFQEQWLVVDVILKRPVPQLEEHTVQGGHGSLPCHMPAGLVPGIRSPD